mgnify:CR=1 FL=1
MSNTCQALRLWRVSRTLAVLVAVSVQGISARAQGDGTSWIDPGLHTKTIYPAASGAVHRTPTSMVMSGPLEAGLGLLANGYSCRSMSDVPQSSPMRGELASAHSSTYRPGAGSSAGSFLLPVDAGAACLSPDRACSHSIQ